jgi:hypothetical protein
MCYTSCPITAPYLYNLTTCHVCNISGCLTCLNVTYCSVCENGLLLVESVITQVDNVTNISSILSNVSSCVGSCGMGYVYNATKLKCDKLTGNNSNNINNNNTNNNNITQNDANNTAIPSPSVSLKSLSSSVP